MVQQALDVQNIGAQLATLFPDLPSLLPVQMLGSGFSSLVIETAGSIVFRIARNAYAARHHTKEVQLLPQLAPLLAVPIPQSHWYAGPCDAFPFGVIGYPKLAGTPLPSGQLPVSSRRPLAHALTSFLRALHSIPPDLAQALHVPGPGLFREQLALLHADVLPPLRDALTRQEYHTIARWWEAFLRDPMLQHITPVLQHGDLWYENRPYQDLYYENA